MQVLYPHSAGLDVHKKNVVAAYIRGYDEHGEAVFTPQTFEMMPRDLLAMADGLAEHGLTPVAMESTGEYWKPVYNLLEARLQPAGSPVYSAESPVYSAESPVYSAGGQRSSCQRGVRKKDGPERRPNRGDVPPF
jgi:hypothetical protein